MEKLDVKQLEELVAEMNMYDGAYEHLIAYNLDEMDEMLSGVPPFEIARMAVFGDFNPFLNELFRFDGYGNLESLTTEDYHKELKLYHDEIVEEARLQGLLG